MEIYVGKCAKRLHLFLTQRRSEKSSFVLMSSSKATGAKYSTVPLANLCCAKMSLITRKSINFTVNEVINTTNGDDSATLRLDNKVMGISTSGHGWMNTKPLTLGLSH